MIDLKTSSFISISSREKEVRELIHAIALAHHLDVICDRLGSCMIHLPAKQTTDLKVMVSFPMDEYGYLVSRINEDGTVSISSVNTPNNLSLIGTKVLLQTREKQIIRGVIEFKKVDFTKHELTDNQLNTADLVVHLGYSSKVEVESSGIKVGDQVVVEGEMMKLGHLNTGRALDIKMGLALLNPLIDALKNQERDYHLYLGGVVQEKVGYRGAVPITTTIQPSINISLAMACDTTEHQLNSGVFVEAYDQTMLPDLNLYDRITQYPVHPIIATKGTSASFIHKSLTGVPSVVIGIHAKNLGTTNMICDQRDLEQLFIILKQFIQEMNAQALKKLIEGDS